MTVVLRAALVLLVLLALVAGAVVYLGWYNVAATEPHWGVTESLLDTVMARSVRRHAAEVDPPAAAPSDVEQAVRTGHGHYAIHCVVCHGAPGVEPAPMGLGLNPAPPDLAEIAGFWSDGELYWIAAHGVKMTGMPGFGRHLDDEAIWSVVAFVRAMEEMSPEDYRALGRTAAARGPER